MTNALCPSCGVTLSIEVSRREKRPDSDRPEIEREALEAFTRWLPAGEYQTSQLHNLYREWLNANPDRPLIGQRNFGLGLQQVGVERRRTASTRFWVL